MEVFWGARNTLSEIFIIFIICQKKYNSEFSGKKGQPLFKSIKLWQIPRSWEILHVVLWPFVNTSYLTDFLKKLEGPSTRWHENFLFFEPCSCRGTVPSRCPQCDDITWEGCHPTGDVAWWGSGFRTKLYGLNPILPQSLPKKQMLLHNIPGVMTSFLCEVITLRT